MLWTKREEYIALNRLEFVFFFKLCQKPLNIPKKCGRKIVLYVLNFAIFYLLGASYLIYIKGRSRSSSDVKVTLKMVFFDFENINGKQVLPGCASWWRNSDNPIRNIRIEGKSAVARVVIVASARERATAAAAGSAGAPGFVSITARYLNISRWKPEKENCKRRYLSDLYTGVTIELKNGHDRIKTKKSIKT